MLRPLPAAILDGTLGFEWEQKGKAAGLRTHIVIALGAALFVRMPQQAGVSDGDPTRVLQELGCRCGIPGSRNHHQRQWSIWLTAAIGVAAGMGREARAFSSALFALVILYTVPKVAQLEGRGSQLGRGDIR